MGRFALPHLSPRAQLACLTGVLLALIGIVFAVEERNAGIERATATYEATLAGELSSATAPAALADGKVRTRAAKAFTDELSDVVSARPGSAQLWDGQKEAVYPQRDSELDPSSAGITTALDSALGGRVDSVRVKDPSQSGQNSDQLATLVPLRAKPSGPAVGAFEVRRPWASVAGSAGWPSAEGLLPVFGALALAWAGIVAATSMAIRNGPAPGAVRGHQLDQLTDLPTRAAFRELLSAATLTAKRDGGLVAVLVMDLDRFKEINDTLGHFNGDMLLKRIGPRLTKVLRDQDTVARLGGDEFAMLLPDLPDHEAIEVAAKRMIAAFAEPFVLGGLAIEIEASVGIAVAPEHGDRVDVLLQRADTAMYAAKTERTGFAFYSDEQSQGSRRRLTLAGELRRAITEDEIVLHYQPKARLSTHEIVGVEALARWVHPTRGVISPAEFIPIAEQTNLLHPLTERVLDRALGQARDWQAQGFDFTVAVNLSARNLMDAGLANQIAQMLRRWGVKPSSLELELTESMLMSDPRRAKEMLSRLRDVGARLSVDDFGTGYSSLAYLKDLPVDAIKIDRSFVLGMEREPSNAAIVRSTVDLGRNLGLEVIAEGVETQAVYDDLARLGCDYAQGYLLARPLPPQELLARVQEIAQSREATAPRARGGAGSAGRSRWRGKRVSALGPGRMADVTAIKRVALVSIPV